MDTGTKGSALRDFLTDNSASTDKSQNILRSYVNRLRVFFTRPFEIRTIHHLSSSGGTLISKCLAAMPEVVLLSEINPLNPGQFRFNPFDPLHHFQLHYEPLSTEELRRAYLARLKIIVNKCRDRGKVLIIRDHSHTDFLEEDVKACNSLIDFTGTKYRVRPLVTLRNPVDAYLSAKESGFGTGGGGFDRYCERFLMFTERYSSAPCFLYEDFVLDPDRVLQEMCRYYGIGFDPNYRSTFFDMRLTGNSGRSGKVISPRPRREYSQEFQQEVLESGHYRKITELFGYRLD